MRINKLIKKLTKIRNVEGDIKVLLPQCLEEGDCIKRWNANITIVELKKEEFEDGCFEPYVEIL